MRQADEPGLINLAAGVPSTESLPVAELRAAFEKAYADDGARLFAYHHPEGDHRLRELFAERLSQRGASVSGPQVLTTTGCQQALQLMLSLLVQPGDIETSPAPLRQRQDACAACGDEFEQRVVRRRLARDDVAGLHEHREHEL